MQKLFEYIEPSNKNLGTYSYRIHELLLRTCIEVEANFKATLNENTYSKAKGYLDMGNYNKINITHHLSDYTVKIPIWAESEVTFKPFARWKEEKNNSLCWYQAYNDSKHNRQNKFKQAKFEHLINAISGLFVLLSSQFGYEDFAPPNHTIVMSGDQDRQNGLAAGIGGFFLIKFPHDWKDEEKYDFNWSELKNENDKL
jgi:hypothetical protein